MGSGLAPQQIICLEMTQAQVHARLEKLFAGVIPKPVVYEKPVQSKIATSIQTGFMIGSERL